MWKWQQYSCHFPCVSSNIFSLSGLLSPFQMILFTLFLAVNCIFFCVREDFIFTFHSLSFHFSPLEHFCERHFKGRRALSKRLSLQCTHAISPIHTGRRRPANPKQSREERQWQTAFSLLYLSLSSALFKYIDYLSH